MRCSKVTRRAAHQLRDLRQPGAGAARPRHPALPDEPGAAHRASLELRLERGAALRSRSGRAVACRAASRAATTVMTGDYSRLRAIMNESRLPQLVLKRHEDRRIRAGHCWVFSNEIDTAATPLTGIAPGAAVRIAGSQAAVPGPCAGQSACADLRAHGQSRRGRAHRTRS